MNDRRTENELNVIYELLRDQTLSGLCALAGDVYETVRKPSERLQVQGMFIDRASKIGPEAVKAVKQIFSALASEHRAGKQPVCTGFEDMPWLELNNDGTPKNTLNNFCSIMSFDHFYGGFRYNLMKNAPEMHAYVDGRLLVHSFTDADEASSERYIEETYGIYSSEKHRKALAMLWSGREYNPVIDTVEALPEWDGVERISVFLSEWMGCEDTSYVREVSRLIFAGGINRLYDPGCKFDECLVLIGTMQGEGKSTIVRWLALNDDWYSEVTQFEGRESIEALEGAWICEISEMLALTKTKEQEAVKAYITRQSDKYRRPYSRNTSMIPRRCIFIGTTNNMRFLKDKTGNRRFYPVRVNMSGYDLFRKEKECREYIRLCWAEARDRYRKGEMKPFADPALIAKYRLAQADAMEDDWREGAIAAYLQKYRIGEKVCARQLQREALTMGDDFPKDPTRKEAHEIGLIMDRMPGWRRLSQPSYINANYPSQRGWIKKTEFLTELPDDEELPFDK